MLQPYPYQPIGGINGEDSEDSIGPTEVQVANNLLFERKQFQTRPCAKRFHFNSGPAGRIDFGRAFDIVSGPYVVAATSNGDPFLTGKLYYIQSLSGGVGDGVVSPGVGTIIEVTGVGTTFGAVEFHNAAAVNGVILFANNSGGMLRWDPNAGVVYTVVAASAYRYVTSHLTRAVGAYKLSGAAGDGTRVGWSRSGDETNWAGGDSGTANLIDSPDEITGNGVLHNILFIARRNGFHLGFPTGVSLPVYRFEVFMRDGEGVHYPSTLDTFDNVAYYCGQSDVHTFDLQTVKSIGLQIRKELFTYLRAGVKFQGFISRLAFPEPRQRYNLIPTSGAREIPHFTYDIQDKIWSRHSYNFSCRGGFYFNQIPFFGERPTTCILNFNSTDPFLWDTTVPCEASAFLTGRVITIGFEEKDMILRRVLLKYRNFGPSTVTCKVRAMLNETAVENDDTQQVGTTQVDRKLYRKWFNINLAGNGFEITLESPAGSAFGGNYLGLLWAESGEYKGEPGF